jgi:hypothetical protein
VPDSRAIVLSCGITAVTQRAVKPGKTTLRSS